jgi:hypothetical protein
VDEPRAGIGIFYWEDYSRRLFGRHSPHFIPRKEKKREEKRKGRSNFAREANGDKKSLRFVLAKKISK